MFSNNWYTQFRLEANATQWLNPQAALYLAVFLTELHKLPRTSTQILFCRCSMYLLPQGDNLLPANFVCCLCLRQNSAMHLNLVYQFPLPSPMVGHEEQKRQVFIAFCFTCYLTNKGICHVFSFINSGLKLSAAPLVSLSIKCYQWIIHVDIRASPKIRPNWVTLAYLGMILKTCWLQS